MCQKERARKKAARGRTMVTLVVSQPKALYGAGGNSVNRVIVRNDGYHCRKAPSDRGSALGLIKLREKCSFVIKALQMALQH